MTALSDDRGLSRDVWNDRTFTLASGQLVYKGAKVAIKLGTGNVVEATGAADEIGIGLAMKQVDATAGAKTISVQLYRQIHLVWFANGSSVASTDLGAVVYTADDNTITLTPTGRTFGRVWSVDSVRGVLVEPFAVAPGVGTMLLKAPTFVYTTNDYALADYPVSGTVYDVATTAAASTISLPANAREGTEVIFAADGTKNGHTVTFRDVTTAISAAITASKRFQARCVFVASKWSVNYTVSP